MSPYLTCWLRVPAPSLGAIELFLLGMFLLHSKETFHFHVRVRVRRMDNPVKGRKKSMCQRSNEVKATKVSKFFFFQYKGL